jgi:hypothetical protein
MGPSFFLTLRDSLSTLSRKKDKDEKTLFTIAIDKPNHITASHDTGVGRRSAVVDTLHVP